MTPNLAQLLASAAIVVFDGVTLRPKAGVTFKPIRPSFGITTGVLGTVAQRVNETGAELSFEPDGDCSGAILEVLHPYKTHERGQPLAHTLRIACTAITPGTDIIAKDAHGLASGTPVKVSYTSIAPTVTGGFPRNTTLYVRATTADTLTLHTTEAGALGDGSVARVDITAQGTGSILISRMRALVIWTTIGVKVTFHNVVVTTLPNLRFTAGATLYQAVTFRAFHKQGEAPAADTLYTITEATFDDSTIDEALYETLTPSVVWGSTGVFVDPPVGGAVEIDFALETSEFTSDAVRVAGMMFQGVSATVKVMVPGLTWAETLEALGMTAARGSALNEQAITVGAGVMYFVARATLEPPDFSAAPDQQMVQALTFKTVRPHTNGIGGAWYEFYRD